MSFSKSLELQGKSVSLSHFYEKEWLFVVTVISIWWMSLWFLFDNFFSMFTLYWPISIIAFFSAAVANATAVGGGFIFLPLFSFYYGLGGIESLKLALSTQAFGMTSGALAWSAKLIQWKAMLVASTTSGIGMVLGTYYWLPVEDVLHFYFGLVSSILGVALMLELFYSRNKNCGVVEKKLEHWIIFSILCLLGGVINAWVSIGIGEVVALWLMFIWYRNIAQAIATGVATLAFCSILGFIFHAQLGGIPWHYLAFTSIGVVLGGRLGANVGILLANRKKNNNPGTGFHLKALVSVVVFIDGVFVLYNTLT